MRLIDPILAELEQESAATLRLLEAIPENKLSWRPHPKSMSLGQLALHIAGLPAQIPALGEKDLTELPKFEQTEAKSRQEIFDTHARSLAAGRAMLADWSDEKLLSVWSFKNGGQTLMAVPRIGLLRGIMLNHLYHHRGQVTVYLRLLEVPVPSVYGPSADVNPFG